MPVQIQLRRDTSAQWNSINPILAQAEVAIETDTNKFKIGNGTTNWINLPYGGLQGTQGIAGIAAAQGSQGTAGTNGSQGTTGTNGSQGTQGRQGTTGTGFNWRSNWSAFNEYYINDVVFYNGSSYIAIENNLDLIPSFSPTHWSIISSQGTTGTNGTQGTQGHQGTTGTNGSQGTQGRQGTTGTGFNWRSNWSAFNEYYINDVVFYNGSSYIAIENNLDLIPSFSPTHWSIISSQGTTGTNGTQGTQGHQGTTGTNGSQGTQGRQGTTGTGFNWRSNWSAFNEYYINDVVFYNGSSYIAIENNLDLIPSFSPTHWSIISSQGTTGTNGTQGTQGHQGIQGFGFQQSQGIQGLQGSQGFSNNRTTSVSDGNSITPNATISDNITQINTQSAGTLTIAAPTGTPTDGQKIIIRIKCTNTQTFSWNAIYRGSSDLSLPAQTTGNSKTDYIGFIYNSTDSKWDLLARTFGY